MKNKNLYYLTAILITSSILAVAGCSKKAEPAISESVEEVEEPAEPEEAEEPEPAEKPTEPEKPVEDSNSSNVGGAEFSRSEEEIQAEIAETEGNIEESGYEIIPTDDTTYYAIQSANVRSGPGVDYSKVGSLSYGEAITSNGKVEQDGKVWIVIKDEAGEIKMVSASLVSLTKPQPQQSQQQPQQPQQPQEPQQPAEVPIDDGGDSEDVLGGAMSGLPEMGGGGFGSSGETGHWDIE